ncbi:MAG TPA: glycosyltransferase family 87 protein [Candidatus Sulfotelmatobacter sp.]|nr:glycosyltransferase family 87 protein [Candidatus Sulfotelmatobacter sp.]
MTREADGRTWLTARRLRAHGMLLGLVLWSVYLWTLATPGWRDRNGNLKGTDFLHFYTLGCLAAEHRGADLYDMNAPSALAAQRVPDAAGIRYLPLYPPQVSILFAPLAHFSYGSALAIWWGFGTVIYGVSCFAVWRVCPELRNCSWTVALLAVAFPAFFYLIAWGQTAALALAFFTLAFLLLRQRRAFLAGLAFGCLAFKPQLGLAVAVVFVAVGAWRIVAGAVLSAAAQLSAGVFYYGMEPLRTWLRMLSGVRRVLPWFEPRPYQTHCLRTFWSMILPWQSVSFALYVISALLVLGVTVTIWLRPVPLSLRYSALLLATILVAPHLTVYDLVILAPAVLLVADWLLTVNSAAATRRMGSLVYLIYVLPLLGPLARWTHVQLSVIAMVALLYFIVLASYGRQGKALTTNDTKVHEGLPC